MRLFPILRMYEFLSMRLAAKSRPHSDYGFYRMIAEYKIGIMRFHRMIPEGVF